MSGGPITSSPVKVTMLLCDAAQVSDGKLFILGGGWSMTGPDPVPSAVALKIDVDWHETGPRTTGSCSWRTPTGVPS